MGRDKGTPISVLIVDDEQDLVEVLAKRLGKRGFTVDAVDSGEAALGKLDAVRETFTGAAVPTSVLLVDDEVELLGVLSKRLSRRGFTVHTAGSGQAALTRLGEGADVDVVVLDQKMVGMTGLQALKSIKEQHPTVEVIMLTGHGSVQDAMDALQDGALDYLTKPCDINVLVKSMDVAKSKRDGAHRQ